MLAAEIKALVEPATATRRASGSARWWRCCSGGPSGSRIQYLRDAADADEAVQDAFVKVFLHIEQYRERAAVRCVVHADPGERLRSIG